jgi:tyrosinase
MAVVRRNILTDTAARDAFIRGVKLLKREVLQPGRPSTYDLFVVWHHRTMMRMTPPGNPAGRNAAHRGPVFLPWHRLMLIALERQLQRVLGDPDFGLPYWDWAADGDRPPTEQRQSPLWGPSAMGGSGDPVATGPFAFDAGDPESWRVRVETTLTGGLRAVDRGLRRSLAADVSTLPTSAQVRSVASVTPYDTAPWDATSGSFRNRLEGWRPAGDVHLHNRVHVWVGGDMGLSTSPNDPVFYLNHANVDRIWAAWQARHGNPPYLPAASAPTSLRGHRANDRLISIFPNPPTPAQLLDVSAIYSYDTLAL